MQDASPTHEDIPMEESPPTQEMCSEEEVTPTSEVPSGQEMRPDEEMRLGQETGPAREPLQVDNLLHSQPVPGIAPPLSDPSSSSINLPALDPNSTPKNFSINGGLKTETEYIPVIRGQNRTWQEKRMQQMTEEYTSERLRVAQEFYRRKRHVLTHAYGEESKAPVACPCLQKHLVNHINRPTKLSRHMRVSGMTWPFAAR